MRMVSQRQRLGILQRELQGLGWCSLGWDGFRQAERENHDTKHGATLKYGASLTTHWGIGPFCRFFPLAPRRFKHRNPPPESHSATSSGPLTGLACRPP